MDRILLDTNAVISLLTDRDPAQRSIVQGLTEQSLKGEIEIVLHQNVVCETIYTLLTVYRVGKGIVSRMIADLLAHPGAVAENHLLWADVLEFWPKPLPDIGDAIVAAAAREGSYPVFTFDVNFRKRFKALGIIDAAKLSRRS